MVSLCGIPPSSPGEVPLEAHVNVALGVLESVDQLVPGGGTGAPQLGAVAVQGDLHQVLVLVLLDHRPRFLKQNTKHACKQPNNQRFLQVLLVVECTLKTWKISRIFDYLHYGNYGKKEKNSSMSHWRSQTGDL